MFIKIIIGIIYSGFCFYCGYRWGWTARDFTE